MQRCGGCGSVYLDKVEYLEEPLAGLGEVVMVTVVFCPTCGWSERHTSAAVPASA
jgi:hypothetical protein